MLSGILSGDFTLSNAITYVLSTMVVVFLTLPVHEWAHGFVSTKLGDPTPRWQGRLTLNPLAHIDWIGAAGILLFGIGWAKPVQVNARYYKNPKWGMAMVAFAGPLSNIIVAFISIFMYGAIFTVFAKTGLAFSNFALFMVIEDFFSYVAQINISLAVFNLIPIPPFDGSRILFTFLPQKYYFKIMQYERYIFIAILALLYSGALDGPLSYISGNLFVKISNLALLPFRLFLGV